MILRSRMILLWCLLTFATVLATEETPPGLVNKDSEQDLQAEATNSGIQAQKREASLSNSYGEPLPPDAYGPPNNIPISAPELPAPVYGVPDHSINSIVFPSNINTPPGAYGPPLPVTIETTYEGPPPPLKPRPIYGPPKPVYGPPKSIYGVPKKNYGPPKQSLPKPSYGIPFKTYGPPKSPKPIYGVPKPVYGPPKPVYGPPKPTYGTPILPPIPNLPRPELPPINLGQNFPAPIYGTPLTTLPLDLKPNFPIPSDIYGPPGHQLGPIGPNDHQIILNDIENNLGGHYGPPQPDPNPRPPHPGIPAPPTPPHVLYDGWKPIPGVSKPFTQHAVHQIDSYHYEQSGGHHIEINGGYNIDQGGNHIDHHGGHHIDNHDGHHIDNHDGHHIDNNGGHHIDNNGGHHIDNHGGHHIDNHGGHHIDNHGGHNIDIHGGHHIDNYGGHHIDNHGGHHIDNHGGHHIDIHGGHHIDNHGGHHIDIHGGHSLDQYGPPPPPPREISLDNHSLPNIGHPPPFAGAQISTGYSHVHQDALANIDLNAIVGGDSNHIDQSKTVFEAHYTEPAGQSFSQHTNLKIIQSAISAPEKPFDSYGAPPLDSFSATGPYPSAVRQQGAKGLSPPSGVYGVPPGSQYGAPPKPPPSNLPIPYGTFSGSNGGHTIHTGGSTPRHPIKFRESVPQGLFQQIGATVNHKDHFGIDHIATGPKYIPPPIREIKDINQQTGNRGLSLSIEPTNLYSLPHSGNALNFLQPLQQPSNLYGSPIDSYAAPLLTVSDHTSSGSNTNSVTATVDGTILANISNLDAAAILKHCPYHEAILKAAKFGESIPSDIASSYVASLSSLGSALSKNQQTLISPQNSFNTPVPGSESVNYNSKDLATASHTLVQTILSTDNEIKNEKSEKSSHQKGKSLKTETGKLQNYKEDDRIQFVSDQIFKTSEKIKNLSEEAKQLQQKIVSTSQNINQVNGQIGQVDSNSQTREIPVKGQLGTYTLQIQSSDDGRRGKHSEPSIPHEQLLSEGLLQSILQAIEQPSQGAQAKQVPKSTINFQQSSLLDLTNIDAGGLVLPAGYEPIDRTKGEVKNQQINKQNIQDQDVQASQTVHHVVQTESHRHRGDIPYTECDLKADNSIRHTIVVPAPTIEDENQIDEVDNNDVAIYFNKKDKINKSSEESTEKSTELVTEISVATSISEEEDERRNAQHYRGNQKEFGDKLEKKL